MSTAVQKKTFVQGASFLTNKTSPQDVFTPEDLSEEQILISKTAADFARNEVMSKLLELEEQAKTQNFDLTKTLLKKAGELGLLAADIPAQYGGLELDKICSLLIAENLSCTGGFSVSIGGHTGIGSWPIIYFGTPEQKAKYLPKFATGELLAAYALSEPGSGSDALGAKAKAVLSPDGKSYILNGTKMWITNAGFADIFIVFAKIDGEKFSCFIVPKETLGLSTGKEEKKLGIHSSSTRQLILENASIPVENLLGEIGKGHKIAFDCLNLGRLKLGGGLIGSAKAIIEHTVKYSTERKQFDKPLSSFGAIKHKLAEMAIRTFVIESMSYRTAGLLDSAVLNIDVNDSVNLLKAIESYAVECSIMKVMGSEMLDFVADEGIQIYGGYGYSEEYPVERYYRDSRINRIFEGTNEINRLVISGMFMKKALQEDSTTTAFKKIMSELLEPIPLDIPTEDLFYAESKIIENAKKICLLITGIAMQKYLQKISEQQEILMVISDIISKIFAMESIYLRTLKHVDNSKSQYMITATKIYINDAMSQIELMARNIFPALAVGDNLHTHLSALKKLTRYTPINTVELRRQLADRLVEIGSYSKVFS